MSSYNFCIGMKEYLENNCEIKFNVIILSGHDSRNGLIRSFSNKENKKFMEYIYKDADLFMKRIYDKYKEFFRKIN